MIIVVAGCVAQQEKEKLLRRVGHLDAVLGTHHISDLPHAIERVRSRERVAMTDFPEIVESLHVPAPHRGKSPVCSYVTIMQGCSNYCTYCVVPYTRGPERSRPSRDIVSEVAELTAKGVKEVTLLGQNVNAYGIDGDSGDSFADLLQRLDTVSGLERVRFTTSHPKDFTPALVRAMADLKSVCEHVHLPLQSGSDRILAAMRRGYTMEQYMRTVTDLRERIPEVAITADMIVGFPGETDADFRATLEALETIRFDQIFSFKYSARPGTAAARLSGHLSEDVKSERLSRVHALQDRVTEEYHRAAEGTRAEILIEGFRAQTGQAFGRTRTNKIVNLVQADGVRAGDLVPVKVTRGLKHSLVGEESND
jgi:tRNA-2-methylthio-N6-dimethylallyladenosine synthase